MVGSAKAPPTLQNRIRRGNFEGSPIMLDVPLWMMGCMCLVLIGLVILLVVLVVIRSGRTPRRPTDLEKDYDDGPRGRDR
jgi:hypothetical protein